MSFFKNLWQGLKPVVNASRFDDFEFEKPPVELVLYKFDTCIFCQRVMAFIRKHKLPVTYRDLREHPRYRQELLALTGRSQVPCLLIDGQPMLESADIVAYLHYIFVEGKKINVD